MSEALIFLLALMATFIAALIIWKDDNCGGSDWKDDDCGDSDD